MHRVDNAEASVSLPSFGSPGPKPNAYFTEKTSLVVATHVVAPWMNSIQEEICSVLTAASITPSKTNRTQLLAAVNQLVTDAGGATTITAVVDDPAPVLGGDLDTNNFAIASVSNADINFIPAGGGTIILNDASVSANDVLLKTNLKYGGGSGNQLAFGTNTQDFQTGSSSRLDISTSGLRLGGANSRITAIDITTTLVSNSATQLPSQGAYKGYVQNYVAKKRRRYRGSILYGSRTISSAGTYTVGGMDWQYNTANGNVLNLEDSFSGLTIPGVISDLHVEINPPLPSGVSVTFSLMKTGTPTTTGLSCTLTAGQSSGNDSTHTYTVATGAVYLQFALTSTLSTPINMVTYDFEFNQS